MAKFQEQKVDNPMPKRKDKRNCIGAHRVRIQKHTTSKWALPGHKRSITLRENKSGKPSKGNSAGKSYQPKARDEQQTGSVIDEQKKSGY